MKSAWSVILSLTGLSVLAVGTPAQEKEMTLKGTILCAKCALKETKTCTTAIVVKEGDKEVTYYLKDKGDKEAYHEEVCGGARKEGTVTGTVTEKDGRKWITPKKVEYAKKKADPPARFAGGKWQQGEVLFRQNCASCHGTNLTGRCMAPSLIGVTRHMTDEGIVAHARKIGETMCCARHIRNLTDAEFTDIIAYFHAVDTDPAVKRRAEGQGPGVGCSCGR
jgi:mono/diheme cytochrome c family protein